MFARTHWLFPIILALAAGPLHAESLDPSFSGDGLMSGSSGEVGVNFHHVALLGEQDGNLIEVVEVPHNGVCADTVCIGITRYTSAGNSIAGKLKAGGLVAVTSAQLDNDGRIVVVGAIADGNSGVFRFKRDLSDDTSFSGDGAQTVSFGAQSLPRSVAIDIRNNIVVVGNVQLSSTDSDFGVARLQENGSMSWSRTVAFDLGPTGRFDTANAVAIGADGKIVVVGTAFDSALQLSRVALARLTIDGDNDTSFCTACSTNPYPSINSGKAIYYFGANDGHQDSAFAVDTVSDGGFLVAGLTEIPNGPSNSGAIARFDLNGNYVNEYLDLVANGRTVFYSVRVVRGAPLRAFVGGRMGSTGNQILFVEAFDDSFNPITNYGSCRTNNVGVCIYAGTFPGNYGPDYLRSLNIDGQGRPLVAGEGVPNNGNENYIVSARITNNTGPLPDSIFHSGFQ